MTLQKQFWKSQPLDVNCTKESKIVSDRTSLMLQINKNIKEFNYSLRHEELDLEDDIILESVTDFINDCYEKDSDSTHLIYKKEVVKFFASNNYIALGFYPKKCNKMIGFVIGSKQKLCYNGNGNGNLDDVKKYNTVEVNFLSLKKVFHNMHMSSYMIAVLSKLCIEKFDTECAVYTTSQWLNGKYYTQKNYYHRLLSVEKIYKKSVFTDNRIKVVKNICNSFNYTYLFDRELHYYNVKHNKLDDENVIDLVLLNLNGFYKKNNILYLEKTKEDMLDIIQNPYFHIFILRNKETNEMDAICYFNIDVNNKRTTTLTKDGYLYWYFFTSMKKKHVHNILEYINEYIYKNGIFDIITVCDPFGFDEKMYTLMKFTKGKGLLNYFAYNLSIPTIEPKKNGLFTI